MNGSIPYTEAIKGRTEENFSPCTTSRKYCSIPGWRNSPTLSTPWPNSPTGQLNFGSADFYYRNEWNNWIKLANTLKLRIAVRYERADVNVAKRVFRK